MLVAEKGGPGLVFELLSKGGVRVSGGARCAHFWNSIPVIWI
jgi:hypothetical protein